jgi:hypothetical protein
MQSRTRWLVNRESFWSSFLQEAYLRVSGRSDKVEAGVHTEVELLSTLGLLLLAHVALVLVIDKVDYRSPRVAVVDVVAKAGSVDDGELDTELLLLELGLDDVDLGYKMDSDRVRVREGYGRTSVTLSSCLR